PVAEGATEEENAQRHPVAIEPGLPGRNADLLRQFRRKNLVGIEKQDPRSVEREVIESPLAFLRPPTLVIKLNDRSTEGTGNLHGGIGALGIDHVNFAAARQRLQAARQVLRFIAHRNNDTDRQQGVRVYRPCSWRGSSLDVRHAQKCASHQRCRTNSAHGRDQEVLPARKRCQTFLTAAGRSTSPRGPVGIAHKVFSTSGRISSRSQCSKGRVKPCLARRTTASGRAPLVERTSRGLGMLSSTFQLPGSAKRNSASLWSS